MLNPDAKLADISGSLEQKPTRDGFGKGLVEAGERDSRVVALCADLAESTRVQWFQEKFPDRYIELGVAEQNLATVASGLANYGKIPFITSYAAFSPGRNNEQIRTTVALNNVPVKIAGAHAGISVGPDGATHQALEDIALMRIIPNMTVIVPADAEEARKATIAAAIHPGPVYIRLGREKTPIFTTAETPFEIGKSQVLFAPHEGVTPEVGIIGAGSLLYNALSAAQKLEADGVGVSVLNVATIKPLDREGILNFVRTCGGKIVTVEEHQAAGGLGSAIAELLSAEMPTPIEFIGVHDRFGQSGNTDELMHEYGLDADAIINAIKKVRTR
jgi:transketolase